jgi:alpha-D-ribose 1-methylphosphonate 5-triphosphate synthase subunit PhnG
MHESGCAALDANTTQTLQNEARRGWLAILAKAELGELEDAWHVLAEKPAYRVLRRVETGLVMVRGRIGGTGQPFNLGEMTITRAAVQLLDGSGRATCAGFGHVAGRAPRKAELVALFDALLQDPARHAAISGALVASLAEKQTAAKLERAAKCAATKVDFLTMVRGE